MKSIMKRVLSAALVLVLVCSLVPCVTVLAVEEIHFDTFEELKQIVMDFKKVDGNVTQVYYDKMAEFVFEEDITLPENMNLCFYYANQYVTIPQGITVEIPASSYLSCDVGLNIKGTVNLMGCLNINAITGGPDDSSKLSIDGSINCFGGTINLYEKVSVDGLENITYRDSANFETFKNCMRWYYLYITSMDKLKEVLTIAQFATDSHRIYVLNIGWLGNTEIEEFIIDESLAIPANTGVSIDYVKLTVAEDCILTFAGDNYVYIGSPLEINGSINAEEVILSYDHSYFDDGGLITIGENGSLNAETIKIYSNSLSSPQEAVIGLDISKYTVTEGMEDGDHYWELTLIDTDTPSDNPFADVAEDAYYYDPVLWAVENNITTGMSETTFAPDATCTRGQIVTFLWRAAGKPTPSSGSNPFTDVAPGSYYYDAVLWAVEKGITTGTSATTFSPDAGCTRGQVATFLWRAQGQPTSGGSNIFTDIASGAYYYDAVLWAVENGVTNGMGDGTFAPDATCTRGQIVTFLYRAMA